LSGGIVQEGLGEEDDDDTPYFDSSEEASHVDEESPEVRGIRTRSRFPRNNGTDAIPQFCVGMTSRGNKNGSEGTDQVWISYEEAFILSKR
jgi:hypothetical protein